MPNLLIPKGRDRDKLIALKRGIEDDKKGNYHIPADKEKARFTIASIPYYSSDRNDAWELWDELPNPKSYHALENGKYELTLDYYDKEGMPTEHYLYSEGTSFADAVSKAWLQWFYNTQWLKKIGIQSMPIPNLLKDRPFNIRFLNKKVKYENIV